MLFLSLLITEGWHIFLIISPAILHEIGHLIAAYACRVRVSEMSVTVMGARMTLEGCYSYTKEFVISLCGPLINIICVCVYIVYIKYNGITEESNDFLNASLSLAITNLLPIKSFDGGRMLQCLLLRKIETTFTNRIISGTSFFTLFTLWCTSVYFLLRYNLTLSVFVFSVSLFANIFITRSI